MPQTLENTAVAMLNQWWPSHRLGIQTEHFGGEVLWEVGRQGNLKAVVLRKSFSDVLQHFITVASFN